MIKSGPNALYSRLGEEGSFRSAFVLNVSSYMGRGDLSYKAYRAPKDLAGVIASNRGHFHLLRHGGDVADRDLCNAAGRHCCESWSTKTQDRGRSL